MNNLSKFAERLKELMEEKPVTPEELSRAIEYNQVYHWLSGSYLPSFINLVRLSDYFECSVEYLIGREKEYRFFTAKTCPPFSERLLEILKEKKFTVYRLSKLSKIDKRTIYDWLQNKYVPQLDNLLKISFVFDCTIDYLIGREN